MSVTECLGENAACKRTITKKDGEMMYERGCGTANTDECEDDESMCWCTKNLCNGSNVTATESGAVLFVSLVFARFFHF